MNSLVTAKENLSSRPSILSLSIFQALGLIITSVGGSGVWFLAAAIASPEIVGALGRIVSTSTLIAGLATAGFGQFMLRIVRSSTTKELQRYFWLSLTGGTLSIVVITTLVELLQNRSFDYTLIAAVSLGIGVAITNLQDSIYLGTGLSSDVPMKGAAIILTRLLLLLGCSLLGVNLLVVLAVFVVSQVGVGSGWVVVRGPTALRKHAALYTDTQPAKNPWSTLLVSYLYSIAISSIVTGIPAMLTSLFRPQEAGTFYLAWTMAGVLSGLSVAVANSIVALSLGKDNPSRRFIVIIIGLFCTLTLVGLTIVSVLPLLLALFSKQYVGLAGTLQRLITGQIAFGLAIVALAAYRTLARYHHLAIVLIAWPCCTIAGVYLGFSYAAMVGAVWGFVASSIAAAVAIMLLAILAIIREDNRRSIFVAQAAK